MQIWVLRANSTRPDDQTREFNILSKGEDADDAISHAITEMKARGWLEIEILRRNAIDDAEAYGFSFIRYGPTDH